jgi:hypothetical protein
MVSSSDRRPTKIEVGHVNQDKIHRETCVTITGADAILTLSWPIFPHEKPQAMKVAAIAQALKSQGCSIKSTK